MLRIVLLVAGLLLAGAAQAETYALGVNGLACPFCAYGVEKQLNRIDGVSGVRIDIGKNLAIVQTRDGAPLSKDQARSAVEDAGFTLRSFEQGGPTGEGASDGS